MEPTPASLLVRLRTAPSPEAWQRFVDLYTPLLYFWACRMGLQASDAADLVQDVFALLVQKLPEFDYDRQRSFRSWLRTVTVNKWRDGLRRRAAALKGAGPEGLEDVAVPDGAEALWENEYRRHVVGQALEVMQGEFQPSTWKAFLGVVMEGKSAAVVGRELGLSSDAVYAAKARVLRRVREELAGLLD
jgi:RNA polymerase sigma-70 factor (ECF subfamily)